MQRRKVDFNTATGSVSGVNNNGSAISPSKTSGKRARKNTTKGMTLGNVVLGILIVASLLIGAATFFFPTQVETVEMTTAKKTKDFVHNALEMEKHLFQGNNNAEEKPMMQQPLDATAEMEKQPSSWVEGEKKLKQKLKVLFERQKEGKDLGVPVLTRWLGEDIPAWPGEGVDVKEWKKQVDAKYKEMAETEQKWRAEMKKFDERNKQQTATQ